VKTETKAEKKEEKQKQEKHKKVAKKQSGQRIDLSNIDHTNTEEEYVVKTEEKKRYVDTRQSTVELDTIESRERIEDMVPDNIKMDKKGGKAKNKKGGKNRREKEKNQQPKKEIKAKVITEVEIPETITVGEFASKMGKTSAEVVKKLM
ncbi:MAG: translation initiation factor IF-2 N-terminal domain-containing protein, partial [Oscillospiraceae bacterium]